MIEVKQLLLQNNIKVKYNVGFTGMDVLRSPTMFKPWISQLKAFIQHFPGVQLKPWCKGRIILRAVFLRNIQRDTD